MPPTGLSRPQGRPGDDHLTLNVSVTTRWRPLDTECFSDDQVTTTWHWMPHWRPGDDHLTLNVSVTTWWRPLDTECLNDDQVTTTWHWMLQWRPLDIECLGDDQMTTTWHWTSYDWSPPQAPSNVHAHNPLLSHLYLSFFYGTLRPHSK